MRWQSKGGNEEEEEEPILKNPYEWLRNKRKGRNELRLKECRKWQYKSKSRREKYYKKIDKRQKDLD